MRLGYSTEFWCDKMGLCSQQKLSKEEELKKLSEFVWFEEAEELVKFSEEHPEQVSDVPFVNTPFVPSFNVLPQTSVERILYDTGGNEKMKRTLANTLHILLSN